MIKPPKGSNVDGVEIFETLLNLKDTETTKNSKEEWETMLDKIIARGEVNSLQLGVRHVHDYNVKKVNEYVQSYFSGFVARKVEGFTKCENCRQSVAKPNGQCPRDKMIESLSLGYLKYPSDKLFNLLCALEHATLQTVGQEELNLYTFQHIVQK